LNVTCNFSESNIKCNPFRDSCIYVLLNFFLLFRASKRLKAQGGIYHVYGKTGHSGWKIKWIVSFHLGSFTEDLRRSNAFVLFLVCSADLDIICCGSFPNHFQRDHNYAPCLPPHPFPPKPNFSLPLFPVFSPFNTIAPGETVNNCYVKCVGVLVSWIVFIFCVSYWRHKQSTDGVQKSMMEFMTCLNCFWSWLLLGSSINLYHLDYWNC